MPSPIRRRSTPFRFRAVPIAVLIAAALAPPLVSCSPATAILGNPKIAYADAKSISILSSGWGAPDAVARQWCGQNGLRAEYQGFTRPDPMADTKLHYYNCAERLRD